MFGVSHPRCADVLTHSAPCARVPHHSPLHGLAAESRDAVQPQPAEGKHDGIQEGKGEKKEDKKVQEGSLDVVFDGGLVIPGRIWDR